MEKEIGSETEMEEGTGGRRKGRRRRKEMAAAMEKRAGSLCVSFHPLVIYSSFESSHNIHYSSRDNHAAILLFLPTEIPKPAW